ncbi:head-tail connector protein [Paracoccus sp. MBLB3053]|uniref:Head-tail connector protein n=1 Tax=Paracoccus aurantius TaxID=3073814 RepID=A0ABU2HUH5_9RHOB|nr:head-tail connector protein [Paracoccus sp. MBLB3053]MDS9468704.1 head-tail connector protein [Paracoccus sp. MBLB3053]
MPFPDLGALKLYARVDFDDEDATLANLLNAASEYVRTATGHDYVDEMPERACFAIIALATHWYQNRELTSGGDRVVPFHVRSLIHQLRDWKDPAVRECEEAEDDVEP